MGIIAVEESQLKNEVFVDAPMGKIKGKISENLSLTQKNIWPEMYKKIERSPHLDQKLSII